jgi:hypothetical protein
LIDFRTGKKDTPEMMSGLMKRILGILKEEDVKVESPAVVAEVIKKHYPDIRRTLNELQRYSAGGIIDKGILANVGQTDVVSLMKYLKNRDFGKMRQWVVENIDADPVRIFRTIYDNMHDYLAPSSIPQIVLLIGEYQYKQAFVQDREINLVAFLTEVMVEAEWKK